LKKDGPCGAHPDRPAVARCKRCSRRLCDACFAFVGGESDPWCARCAVHERAGGASLVVRVILFVATSAVLLGVVGFLGWRHGEHGQAVAVGLLGAFLTVAIGWGLGKLEVGQKNRPTIRPRADDDVLPEGPSAMEGAAHPFRARLALVAVRSVPMLSGRATAFVVLGALVLSVVALPAALRLPQWIELELGLGVFWLVLAGLLTGLLFRGYRLREDHALALPWNVKKGKGASSSSSSGPSVWDGCAGCDVGSGCGDAGEGIVVVLVVIVVAAVAFGVSWLIVELVAPLLFFLAYEAIVRSVGRVAHDTHDCEGSLGKSLLWGVLWSTVYLAPFSGSVWVVHALLARR